MEKSVVHGIGVSTLALSLLSHPIVARDCLGRTISECFTQCPSHQCRRFLRYTGRFYGGSNLKTTLSPFIDTYDVLKVAYDGLMKELKILTNLFKRILFYD